MGTPLPSLPLLEVKQWSFISWRKRVYCAAGRRNTPICADCASEDTQTAYAVDACKQLCGTVSSSHAPGHRSRVPSTFLAT